LVIVKSNWFNVSKYITFSSIIIIGLSINMILKML
jgi:hypothetical protein